MCYNRTLKSRVPRFIRKLKSPLIKEMTSTLHKNTENLRVEGIIKYHSICFPYPHPPKKPSPLLSFLHFSHLQALLFCTPRTHTVLSILVPFL